MTLTLIQAMRGLCSLCVAIVHVKIFFTRYGDPGFFEAVPDWLGAIPTMFFAISGYFMAMLLARKDRYFLYNRLIRIYPTYFTMIAIAFILRAFSMKPLRLTDLPLVMTLFPFGSGLDYKLGIEWTLIYEMVYYFICAYYCRPQLLHIFPRMCLAWYLATLVAACIVPVSPMANILTFCASPWNLSFIAGVLVYFLLASPRKIVPWIWAVVLVAATYTTFKISPFLANKGIVFFGGLAGLILIGLVLLESLVRAPWFLVRLGDFSYVFYLIHVSIILTVIEIWMRLTGTKPNPVTGIVAVGLCLLLSWPLGRLDLTLHKYCKSWMKRMLDAQAARRAAVFQANGVPCATVEAERPGGPTG